MLWLSHSVDLSSYTLKLLLVFSEDWIGSCFTWLHMSILGKRSTWAGPILESKGMRAIFQKKKAKYLKIWAKMYKIWKHFEKGQPHAWDHRMKQLEYALLRGLGKGGNHDFFLVEPISRIGFLNLYRTYISLPWIWNFKTWICISLWMSMMIYLLNQIVTGKRYTSLRTPPELYQDI